MKIMMLAAVVALSLTLAACGPAAVTPASGPGDVVSVVRVENYYPACENEILEFEGTTYYPFEHEGNDEFTPPTAMALASWGYSVSVPRVGAPGPGDDSGTLTIYEGGFAYFESDSGNLTTWLTTEEQTYNWVC